MANNWEASGSAAADSALSKERAVPQVNLSFSTSLTAFGFGVSSMSAILGMGCQQFLVWLFLAYSSARNRIGFAFSRDRNFVPFGRVQNRMQRGMQRMPWQDRALDP